MASELRVNTLKDASGNNSIGVSYVAEGSAKAWLNLNGSATFDSSDTEIRDSFNMTSTTDGGTGGPYSASFTSSMNDTNYSFSSGLRLDSGANPAYSARAIEFKAIAEGSISFVCQVGSGSANDMDHLCPQITGDLA